MTTDTRPLKVQEAEKIVAEYLEQQLKESGYTPVKPDRLEKWIVVAMWCFGISAVLKLIALALQLYCQ